ncbi:hypothetical protein [Aquimarina sp. AU474]|uniref:hypothetical protein n=1 Tax=Aquimarina sp. AU474 TaxID=2108529 RepID=UPI000D68E852|nr:hypothetical protein [Aquimarina sp. AU474]
MKEQNRKKISLNKIQVAQLDRLSKNQIKGGTHLMRESGEPDDPLCGNGTGQTSVDSNQACDCTA